MASEVYIRRSLLRDLAVNELPAAQQKDYMSKIVERNT